MKADKALLLGKGGEGAVYALAGEEGLVAKVYHRPSAERARKLAIMVAHPPQDPTTVPGHRTFAWPVDLLTEDRAGGEVVGFLMTRVSNVRPIFDFYNPASRRQHSPLFSYFYLHRAARNMAAALGALHVRGYVVGDVNESNFMLEPTALVTVVDTDSLQVRDPDSGASYRCRVGKPEFTPPELQSAVFASFDRVPEHDLFGLAVLLFQTLMEGAHPFAGVYLGPGDPPPLGTRIASGCFPLLHGRAIPFTPAPLTPPFDVLSLNLQRLFMECFDDGARDPRRRPSAATWQAALKDAEADLVACRKNAQHWYGKHRPSCPWCERALALKGWDPFPSQTVVARNEHRPRRQKTKRPVVADPQLWTGPPVKTSSGNPPQARAVGGPPQVWPGSPTQNWSGPMRVLLKSGPPFTYPVTLTERVIGFGCGGLVGALLGFVVTVLSAESVASRLLGDSPTAVTSYILLGTSAAALLLGMRLALRPPRA